MNPTIDEAAGREFIKSVTGLVVPNIEIPKMSYDEFLRMRSKAYNDKEGTLTGCNCSLCKNKGYISKIIDGSEVLARCDCMNTRENLDRIRRSGLSKLLKECKFSTFVTDKEWRKTMLDTAKRYCLKSENEWLYVSGRSGCGKTHICTAICNQFLQKGINVRYEMWTDIEHRLNGCNYDSAEYDRLMGEIASWDVLYIDDFLKVRRSENSTANIPDREIDQAYEIINRRYIARKKTIISSEFTMDELFGIDSAVAGRIVERTRGTDGNPYVISAGIEAENYRLRR